MDERLMYTAHVREFGRLVRDVRDAAQFDPHPAQGQQLHHRPDAVVVRPERGRCPAHVVDDDGNVGVRQLIGDVRQQPAVGEQLQMEVMVSQPLQQGLKRREGHKPASAARITGFEVRHPHAFDASGC